MKTQLFKVFFLLLLFSYSSITSQVKNDNPEFISFVKELTKSSKDQQSLQQILWFPLIYWELSLKDSPYINDALMKDIKSMFKNYDVFVALNVEIQPLSGFVKKDIEEFKLIIDGKDYLPIKNYPEDISTMLSYFKPIFKQMLGQMGESMELYVFDNHEKVIPSPYTKSEFVVHMNSTSYSYKLPLSELVMKKTCPKDGEKLNGSWDYCPWHGTKLE